MGVISKRRNRKSIPTILINLRSLLRESAWKKGGKYRVIGFGGWGYALLETEYKQVNGVKEVVSFPLWEAPKF